MVMERLHLQVQLLIHLVTKSMRVIGKKISCMATEYINILQVLSIQVNGTRANNMAKE